MPRFGCVAARRASGAGLASGCSCRRGVHVGRSCVAGSVASANQVEAVLTERRETQTWLCPGGLSVPHGRRCGAGVRRADVLLDQPLSLKRVQDRLDHGTLARESSLDDADQLALRVAGVGFAWSVVPAGQLLEDDDMRRLDSVECGREDQGSVDLRVWVESLGKDAAEGRESSPRAGSVRRLRGCGPRTPGACRRLSPARRGPPGQCRVLRRRCRGCGCRG